MITITKILPPGSKPAPVLLEKMGKIPLTSEQRFFLPPSFEADGVSYKSTVQGPRALEVDDLVMDESGALYVITATPEKVFHVTGDLDLMRQAAAALMMRGYRVCNTEDGFGVVSDPDLGYAFEQIGLQYTEVTEPFVPVPLPRRGGCCCGHHHHEGEECGCGHHHHEGEECGCGHHHHEGGGSCSCNRDGSGC